METNKPSIFDLYGRKDKERKYSIKEEIPLKKEIRETDMKDPKGRSISFKYFIKRLEVVEDEKGSWGDYTFRNGPGTYYTVTTTKLRDGKVFGATFNTKYVDSQEEAEKIGETYLKKNTKKLSTFKEHYMTEMILNPRKSEIRKQNGKILAYDRKGHLWKVEKQNNKYKVKKQTGNQEFTVSSQGEILKKLDSLE
jgi:hypothetical protein